MNFIANSIVFSAAGLPFLRGIQLANRWLALHCWTRRCQRASPWSGGAAWPRWATRNRHPEYACDRPHNMTTPPTGKAGATSDLNTAPPAGTT